MAANLAVNIVFGIGEACSNSWINPTAGIGARSVADVTRDGVHDMHVTAHSTDVLHVNEDVASVDLKVPPTAVQPKKTIVQSEPEIRRTFVGSRLQDGADPELRLSHFPPERSGRCRHCRICRCSRLRRGRRCQIGADLNGIFIKRHVIYVARD